ncbi:MAG: hypothetical protein ACKVH8_23415 [Pirellulales bacterium]
MPLIQSKATISESLSSVLIAPFALLLMGAITNWWKLLANLIAITIAMTVFIILDPPGFFDLPPTKEITDTFLMIIGGTILFIVMIMTISIPLAIRDCLVYQTTWKHDPDCLDAARDHFKLLIRGDYKTFHEHLVDSVRLQGTAEQFSEAMKQRHIASGRPIAIIECDELQIPYAVYSEREFDSRIDAIVEIVFQSQGRLRPHRCTFYLNCKENYQIVKFEYSPCE